MTIAINSVNGSDNKQNIPADFNDNKLLKLIAERQDREALTELYNRYKPLIGRFLQRDNCDPKIIEEVYNDVMLTVWKKASSFRGESKVSTWLFTIAYRTRLAHSKKESRHKHSDIDEMIVDVESENVTYITEPNPASEALHAAMTKLSEQHKLVIELSYFHGYSTVEIAGIMRCPQNTVKTRLFHARKKLKDALEADQAPKPVTLSYENSEPSQNGFFAKQFAF